MQNLSCHDFSKYSINRTMSVFCNRRSKIDIFSDTLKSISILNFILNMCHAFTNQRPTIISYSNVSPGMGSMEIQLYHEDTHVSKTVWQCNRFNLSNSSRHLVHVFWSRRINKWRQTIRLHIGTESRKHFSELRVHSANLKKSQFEAL